MARRWLLNIILGFCAFLFTFLFSMMNNTWKTSAFRAGIGFIVFFLFAYILRFVFFAAQKPSKQDERIVEMERNNDENEVEQDESSFQSISLGSLHDEGVSKNIENIEKVTRLWASQSKEG